jgi:ABC-type transport system involved in multi-copper enzyme maturation permease subunit
MITKSMDQGRQTQFCDLLTLTYLFFTTEEKQENIQRFMVQHKIFLTLSIHSHISISIFLNSVWISVNSK